MGKGASQNLCYTFDIVHICAKALSLHFFATLELGGHLCHNFVLKYVSGQLYEHSSILKFIERRFGLPTLASVNHQFDILTP